MTTDTKQSKHAPGPWDDEPDSIDFESHGLPCKMRRGGFESGHWCGYVGVPKGHPLHNAEYGDTSEALEKLLERLLEAPANEAEHTFARALGILSGKMSPSPEVVFEVHGGITFSSHCVSTDGHDDKWWFGFDCAHSGDMIPGHLRFGFDTGYDTYKDEAYVRRECELLAEQLAALAAAEGGTQ